MVQGYYTLDEAARILGMPSDQLSHMAQKREVRAFADRGSWRFRTQDIEELARRLGKGSDPELQLGEALKPKPHDSPAPLKPAGDPGVFNFSLGDDSDQVEIGQEILGAAGKGGSSGRLGSPKPSSDSDVRLVADGSDLGFEIAGESGKKPAAKKAMESDADVKLVTDSSAESVALGAQAPKSKSDSDIRLDLGEGKKGHESGVRLAGDRSPEDSVLTDDIDLDAEMRKAEQAGKGKLKPAATSPFELSADDLAPVAKSKKAAPDSSDFELTPMKEDRSPLSLSSSDELTALSSPAASDEVALGGPAKKKGGGHDSGINLKEPADSGISLEQKGDASDEIEFELTLDADSTPKPAKKPKKADSDSEFELTLDESGDGLAPLEDEGKAAEKDIFETDFEVPSLEDESGSQAVALDDSDSDLENSDFDLALDEGDASSEEESGSQVVQLDDEEADEGASTVARPSRKPQAAAQLDDDDDGDLLAGAAVAVDEDEDLVTPSGAYAAPAAALAPAPWGPVPALFLMPCVVLLFFVALMGFELLHVMWGYKQGTRVSGPIVRAVAKMFFDSKELPSD